MVRQLIQNEEGYTLVEVLVALAIFTAVVSLVSLVFIFISGRMNAWDDQTSFYNDFQIINNKLHNDLFRANSIAYTDSTLSIGFEDNKNRSYSWKHGKLRINGSPYFSTQDCVVIHISDGLVNNQNVYKYQLFFGRERRELVDSAVIKLRKPALWN